MPTTEQPSPNQPLPNPMGDTEEEEQGSHVMFLHVGTLNILVPKSHFLFVHRELPPQVPILPCFFSGPFSTLHTLQSR